MSKPAWKPWHKVVSLRDDLRSGDLAMNLFAADLYDVVMGRARPVYGDPREFFALTYPTFNLRQLARDVVLRLAGRSDKAVRQLELTYGGGKTHTLITLYHLVRNPDALPDVPAVAEFLSHIGQTPPRTEVAVLPFDKLDVEKGMEVRGPAGELRWLKHPWSVLAFQIAGADGLKRLHPESRDAERESAPAEPLLAELLARPAKDGKATLVLIDETLMYAREKVGLDPTWRGRLVNFFQYLTQAATKVNRCAVVASLLATDPRKGDALGKELTQELYAIFRREREEGVQPVLKEDVAEVLRRRFFTPDSIRDRESFRPHVTAALKGIAELDEQTRRDGKAAENRFLASYPFHPDLTEVLYGKWTNLESFQRTRGVLRTFALALRSAEGWDEAPLVGVNVFLAEPTRRGLSEAARELTGVATAEEYEGKRQEWAPILEGELVKARDLQDETTLSFREVEQAVVATFLHSQPIGQKAMTRDLLVLLGPTRPGRIELENALRRWAEVSWFLDEVGLAEAEAETGGRRPLPKTWRLGSRPNLTQMHHDACTRVSADLIDAKLLAEVGKLKVLTAGVRDLGIKPHVLPEKPKDIEDDGDFHFAILGPKSASSSGNPSAEARRYLDEKTGPEAPRVFRNAVVLAVPSREGLEVARNRIRDYLGWEEVQHQLKGQDVDPIRQQTLAANVDGARRKVPEAIQLMYGIVVTVSDQNEAQAFKLTVTPGEPLFNQIKADPRARMQDTAISADALLPEGPYNLWRSGETARRVKDLVGAFAQFPHLPKMLRSKGILDTLVQGAREGFFVLRVARPDGSVQTFWRQEPGEATLKEPGLEVVLPEAAELIDVPPALLAPQALPGLWSGDSLPVQAVRDYFAGGKVVQVPRQGYEEPVTIPKAAPATVEAGVTAAVSAGKLWLTAGPASFSGEPVPPGVFTADAALQLPPAPIPPSDLLPTQLPQAWGGEVTTAAALDEALAAKVGKSLPWPTVSGALSGAFQSRLLERSVDSGPWPCDRAGAAAVRVRLPQKGTGGHVTIIDIVQPPVQPGVRVAQADLRPNQLQDLAELVGDLTKTAVGCELKFNLRIEIGGKTPPPADVVEKLNALLREVAEGLQFGGP